MWGALIGGAASLIGGALNRRESRSEAERANERLQQSSAEDRAFMDKWNQISLQEGRDARQRYIRERVADARAAGLHPLFALGGSPGLSPSFNTSATSPGYVSASGSHLGEGIAAAGSAIGEAMSQRNRERLARDEARRRAPYDAALIRQANASALRDEMEAARTASEIKRAEQEALVKRPAGDGVELRPYDFGPTLSFGRRPTVEHPRQSFPSRVEMVSADGKRRQVLNPDLGFEEIGQAEYVWQRVREAIESLVDQGVRGYLPPALRHYGGRERRR